VGADVPAGDALYTLREIAAELALPESTVRYYRDAFAAYIPTVGRGRRRRYPREAAAVLSEIARQYADGRSREAIEASLGGVPQAPPAADTSVSAVPERAEVLATVLEGERERREVLWQLVREIVRLGEAVERQHVILGGIVDRLAGSAERALPAGAEPAGSAPSASPPVEMAAELAALRQELARERELVERLRRSKLELERRAAEAESRLEERPRAPPGGSLLERLRARSAPDAGGP
jgi:DNA-binding transcriptional MerR regulator